MVSVVLSRLSFDSENEDLLNEPHLDRIVENQFSFISDLEHHHIGDELGDRANTVDSVNISRLGMGRSLIDHTISSAPYQFISVNNSHRSSDVVVFDVGHNFSIHLSLNVVW